MERVVFVPGDFADALQVVLCSQWVERPDAVAVRVAEECQLDDDAQLHIQQNIEKLLAFTLLVEKNCGISSRLLWTESGEPLAQKLIDRLQRVN